MAFDSEYRDNPQLIGPKLAPIPPFPDAPYAKGYTAPGEPGFKTPEMHRVLGNSEPGELPPTDWPVLQQFAVKVAQGNSSADPGRADAMVSALAQQIQFTRNNKELSKSFVDGMRQALRIIVGVV